MTTYPVIERIAQVIESRLQSISIANGYNVDIAAVSRPTRLGDYGPNNLTAVIVQSDPELDDEHAIDGNPNAIAWRQPFVLLLFVRLSDDDPTPTDQAVNIFAADVQKALTAPADWQQFQDIDGNPLAFNAWIKAPRGIVTTDAAATGTEFEFVVNYRTNENDPYTAR